jgi:hypothetical protein
MSNLKKIGGDVINLDHLLYVTLEHGSEVRISLPQVSLTYGGMEAIVLRDYFDHPDAYRPYYDLMLGYLDIARLKRDREEMNVQARLRAELKQKETVAASETNQPEPVERSA